jgi:hypothetical protein
MSKIIMGVNLKKRMEEAPKFQELLSKYGCSINTRIGLHAAGSDTCSPSGLILLEFVDDAGEAAESLEKELADFDGAVIRKMVF